MRLNELPSRIPGSALSSAERLDPFYDYVWARGSYAQMRSRRKMAARQEAGLRKVPSWFTPTVEEITEAERNLHTKRRHQKLAVLAALDMWRSMTIQQAAALTGMPELVDNAAAIIRDLYALDLVDVGNFEGFGDRVVRTSEVGEWLIRPTRSARYAELVAPYLTYPEAVRITGGTEFLTGGQYDRHNILTTELGLRVAEHGEGVAAVLGEKWSSQSLLMNEGWGRPDPHAHLQGRGDLTIVRDDGLRIVVEVTASMGRAFQQKVDRWVQRLASGSLATQGVVVLFVTAGEQHPTSHDRKALHTQVRNAIIRSVRSHPGMSNTSRTAERVFVARWDELFPERGAAADGFPALEVSSPVGVYMERSEEMWAPQRILDKNAFPYTPGSALDPHAVIANAQMFTGTPWWFRDGSAPQLAMDAVKTLWPEGLPGLQPGDMAGSGAAGHVTLPERVSL